MVHNTRSVPNFRNVAERWTKSQKTVNMRIKFKKIVFDFKAYESLAAETCYLQDPTGD
jgi:hypothetical protein